MRKITSVLVLLATAIPGLAVLPAPMPRRSPELTIYEPSGKTTLLSAFRGKVVVIEFLFIASPHCLRVAQTLNRLEQELGPRGLQSVAVAFPAPGSDANGPLVTYIVHDLKLTYPVGYTDSTSVDKYLERGRADVLNIPQVVVIDRSGMIRAQSGAKPGDPKLEDEASLRKLLDPLLKENPPSDNAAKTEPLATTRKTQ